MHALSTVTLWSLTRWKEEVCRKRNERKKERKKCVWNRCCTAIPTNTLYPLSTRLSVVFFLTLFYCVTLLQLRPTLVHFIRDCSFCCLFFLWFFLLFFLPPIHQQNIQSIPSQFLIYFLILSVQKIFNSDPINKISSYPLFSFTSEFPLFF